MSDRRELTGGQAVALLRKVVFGKGPEYVYPRQVTRGFTVCHNFRDSKPSCIVGHVLHELGLTFELAEELGIDGIAGAQVAMNVLDHEEDFDWRFSREANHVLITAQSFQDAGAPWGVSLEHAERALADGVIYHLTDEWGPGCVIHKSDGVIYHLTDAPGPDCIVHESDSSTCDPIAFD